MYILREEYAKTFKKFKKLQEYHLQDIGQTFCYMYKLTGSTMYIVIIHVFIK